jgi:hypothetical protein
MKKKKGKDKRSFLQLPRAFIHGKCEEWKRLSGRAKLLYVYLKGCYNGSNNGEIHLHYSQLKGHRGISSSSAIVDSIRELEKGGWIERTMLGGMYRHNNLYRLTWKYDNCHSDKVVRDPKER